MEKETKSVTLQQSVVDKKTKCVILQHSEFPQRISAAAATLSYKDGTAEDIYGNLDEGKCGKFIRRVISIGHKSVIEHANFSIGFENVPVLFEQYLIEHRLAAYTVKSRRYVNYEGAGYIVPEEIKKNPELKLQYEEYCAFLFDSYKKLVDNGIHVEDARFVLPYSFKTNIICTMNARELGYFLYGAIHGRGKKFPEIVKIAKELHSELEKIAPALFSNLEEIYEGEYGKDEALQKIFFNELDSKDESSEPVELLDYTKDAANKIILSAMIQQTGISTEKASELINKIDKKEILGIIRKNIRPRELEQANYTFRLNSISLPILTHLTRHRIQSLIVPTLDSINPDRKIYPKSIKDNPELSEIYDECFKRFDNLYGEFKQAGISRQTLAYLMPSGVTIDVITTMNARELYHFFKLRACVRAQWEIRFMANRMLNELKKIEPLIFESMGPSCAADKICPEGNKSCGIWKNIEGAKLK